MTLIFKLAYRNIKGAGLRTWLNVSVLTLTYILIVWHQGFFTGMLKQGTKAMIDDDIGGGQYWHKNYDPIDPLTYDDSHGIIPDKLQELIKENKATPILIRQGAIYPKGRMQTILLRGIDPEQTILKIPSKKLISEDEDILPVLIGKRMARTTGLSEGDTVTVRWRDVNGTFDAIDGTVVEIMNTKVPAIDYGQLWVPLKTLQKITCMENEASYFVLDTSASLQEDMPDWKFRNQDFLLKDITDLVKSKRISAGIMYAILLFLGILAIFDTQILSIFRRRKEIGTLMALGMSRIKIIVLFTLEGVMHGILAIFFAVILGTPLILFTSTHGIPLPKATEGYGFAVSEKLFPAYSIGLIIGTVTAIMITVTIVSFLPSRRIAKLRPTDALRGKVS